MTQTLVMLEGDLGEIEKWAEANPLMRYCGDAGQPFSLKNDHPDKEISCIFCTGSEDWWQDYFSQLKRIANSHKRWANQPITGEVGHPATRP